MYSGYNFGHGIFSGEKNDCQCTSHQIKLIAKKFMLFFLLNGKFPVPLIPSEEVYNNDHLVCNKPNLTGLMIFRKRNYDTNNGLVPRNLNEI
jgi:hypothetical protein